MRILPRLPARRPELAGAQRQQLGERLGVPEGMRDQQVVVERERRERVAVDLGEQDVAVQRVGGARVELGEPAQGGRVGGLGEADLDVVGGSRWRPVRPRRGHGGMEQHFVTTVSITPVTISPPILVW